MTESRSFRLEPVELLLRKFSERGLGRRVAQAELEKVAGKIRILQHEKPASVDIGDLAPQLRPVLQRAFEPSPAEKIRGARPGAEHQDELPRL